jgi:hypothetical protein
MVTLEYGSGEVVKASIAGLAAIFLPLWLSFIMPVPDYLWATASSAMNPFGPPEVSDGLKALGVVDETFNPHKLASERSSHIHELSSEVEGAQDNYLSNTRMSSLFR